LLEIQQGEFMAKQKLVTQQAYADHLGISRQAVNKMVRDGRIPSQHGRINPEEADLALAPTDAQTGENTLAEAIRRKEWALAGLRELELQRKSAEVVDVAYVAKTQGQINANVRARLLAIPVRLAPRVVGISSPAKIKAILEAEIRQVCEELVKVAGTVEA
jgi:phage terminase Nu1 subunit (DNA packaging protein)